MTHATQLNLFAQPLSAPSLTVPSVTQQTGWRRPFPKMLCQDNDALMRMTAHDFDLTDRDFLDYALGRGVLFQAGTPYSRRWRFTADHAATRDDFMADTFFRFAIPNPKTGVRYLYTPEEMEFHWDCMLRAKAKLQDCWELYLAHAAPAAAS